MHFASEINLDSFFLPLFDSFKTKGNLTKHMKSKAHFKKCTELGISPAQMLIDEEQNDYDDGDRSSRGNMSSRGNEGSRPESEDDDNESDDDGDDESSEGKLKSPCALM